MLSKGLNAVEDLKAGKGKDHHQRDGLPEVPKPASTEQLDHRLNYLVITDIAFNFSKL